MIMMTPGQVKPTSIMVNAAGMTMYVSSTDCLGGPGWTICPKLIVQPPRISPHQLPGLKSGSFSGVFLFVSRGIVLLQSAPSEERTL